MTGGKESNNHRKAFSFVSGRHHGPECWDHIRGELYQHDILSVAPDLPIENVRLTLNDHARILVETERTLTAEEIWRVGWSWGANVTVRETKRTPVVGIIHLAGAFHPNSIRSVMDGKVPSPQHSVAYDAMEHTDDQRAREENAGYVFYDDVEDDTVKTEAVGRLRYHPRRRKEPLLDPYPTDLAAEYVLFSDDKALLTSYQADIAARLGLMPVTFESSHGGAMIDETKARKLARLLIDLSNKKRSS